MAQALLIDVATQKVTTTTLNDPTEAITIIGNGCTSIDAFKLPNGDYILYDLGASFRSNPDGGFSTTPMNWLVMGKAVVMGWDDENGTIQDCLSPSNDIATATTWYDANYCEQAQK